MKRYDLSKIMKKAWALFTNARAKYPTFADALRKSWKTAKWEKSIAEKCKAIEEQEKEYRTQISKENRKIAKREWIRNKRQNENDKQLFEFVKQQHIEASKELSYSFEISDLAYRKWNSSAYHRNSKGNLVIDRKLKVGSDVPKSINMNIKIPTQKYKKKYCYSI